MSKYIVTSNFTNSGKRYFTDNVIDGEFSEDTIKMLLGYGLIESQGLGSLEIDSEVVIVESNEVPIVESNEEIFEENKNKKGNK